VQVCTVINRAWVAHARVLAKSLHAHEPDARMSVLIVDPIDGLIDPSQEPFELLAPQDLDIDDFAAMSVRYGAVELCCALKPSLMSYLLEKGETVVYLDSDVRVYAPLGVLASPLTEHPFLLTPHLLAALPDDGLEPSELAILLAGSYNLGFAAARDTPGAHALLRWWSRRLRTGSRLDAQRGLMYDQRWADLIPGLADSVGILRDPGINFGYWRVPGCRIERDGDRVLVDGKPLRCFHFTGFDPAHPGRLSRYENRTSLSEQPVLRELCAEFAEQLSACGHAQASRWPYGYGATASGLELTPMLRGLWDRGAREGALDQTPFAADGESAFLRWLSEPQPSMDGEPLSLYLAAIYEERSDLRERFPERDGRDRDAYIAWADEQSGPDGDEVIGLLRAPGRHARRAALHTLRPGARLHAERGQAVVCIPVYGAPDLFAECLTSVLANTPPNVPILIADDASPDPAIERFVGSLRERLAHEVFYLRQPTNLGFPGNVNAACAAAAPADIVVLNSDCIVSGGWLEGLRRAAYSDGLVASASALTNHGTILSVPRRNEPLPGLPQHQDLEHVASAVRKASLRLYPQLPTAVGHCMYLRRHALDLVGDFDLAFSPGYGEEVDFSQRCLLHGLMHVAADDVFVLHHAGGSFLADGEGNPAQADHERIISARYPYYERTQAAASKSAFGRLPRALTTASRALRGLTATIDARCLGPVITGTQIHTIQVIRALSETDAVGMRVIVPPDLSASTGEQLEGMRHVQLLPHTEVHPAMDKTDIAHRPYQVSNSNDLLILRCAGERQVITQQDLIAYRNPGYFPGYPQWEQYRRLTRQAMAMADASVFFSHHAAQDALREDLIDLVRVRVVYIGVDHGNGSAVAPSKAPAGVEQLLDHPMLLCLGTDFRHKNRLFALRLAESLRQEHDWDGMLVLAGPRVSHGSSAGEEAAYLATRPELAERVITLPAVGEGEKRWLLERCSAVLYPTTYEGFGLMPFEAAASERPCVFAAQTALAETLPVELATLVPWDPRASAERVFHLLRTPGAAAAQIREIRQAGTRFTWQSTGESLIEVYGLAAISPSRDSARLSTDLVKIELEREEAERKYNELWECLTPDARVLAAPDGPLSDSAQHALAAVARRPALRRLVLAPLQLVHRLGSRAGGRPQTAPQQISGASFNLHFEQSNRDHMREQLSQGDPEQLIPEP
jgi:GT2 family glycosyltransferase/glycosyltransferase involved in cell wall biosynthesis